jgi:hypothetical protein
LRKNCRPAKTFEQIGLASQELPADPSQRPAGALAAGNSNTRLTSICLQKFSHGRIIFKIEKPPYLVVFVLYKIMIELNYIHNLYFPPVAVETGFIFG